ncbi:ATP-binding protein [Patescibacteria group bacterium]|nr:ATP-binding protein [Patescibacteria group bacterium]MBU4600551.1 ATP-binding protein [Patescibacteria group bacterium]MCG2697653.1 ATP-binding protein [Candidatus Parcubacteria bacterium]
MILKDMKDLNLLKYNRHWDKGFRYSFAKKRDFFDLLIKSLSKKQIIELIGLRRTGKTVLFFQIIDYLLENNTDPFSIWYFTFDDEKIELDELLKEFQKQTGADFKKRKVFVFLDEIQKLDNFQSKIKVYYDLYPNIKFFISGSTSLFVKKKTMESLAGRISSFFLHPLNFKEYLNFKDKSEFFQKPAVFKQEIEKEFKIFLESQFVESADMEDGAERKEYFISIMKKIIFEDIPQIFPVENPDILWRLVRIIGQAPGIFINLQNLSQEIGISNKTLSNYLFYLEEAFLVKKVYNFSRNMLTTEKKLKRFYLASPSFSWAVSDFAKTGELVENFAVSLMDYKFFWRDAYKHEVDFIGVKDDVIAPVEIKYRNKFSKADFKNLILFSKKFKVKKAILYQKTVEEKIIKFDGLEIESKPVYFIVK